MPEVAALREQLAAVGNIARKTYDEVSAMRSEVHNAMSRVTLLEDHDGHHRENIRGMGARIGAVEQTIAEQRGEERGRISTRGLIGWVLGTIVATGAAVATLQRLIGS